MRNLLRRRLALHGPKVDATDGAAIAIGVGGAVAADAGPAAVDTEARTTVGDAAADGRELLVSGC